MRKFFILLKKEIQELLTPQVIIPLLITSLLFYFLGNVLGKEQEKNNKPVEVNVLNEDNTTISKNLLEVLKHSKVNVSLIQSKNTDDAVAQTKRDKKTALLVIPTGFEESLNSDKPENVAVYMIMSNFSALGGKGYNNFMIGLASANEILSGNLINQNIPNKSLELLKNPVKPNEFVVIGDKKVNASPTAVANFVSQQTMFIPIILFFVIVFASQMIATSIANEKENKTLETLLTAPVSRKSIVMSKMVAAGIIALLASTIYIFGFRSYINGLMGSADVSVNMGDSIRQLGLNLTPASYALLGVALFIGILVALAISLILGAFAKDVKSVAGLISPLMVMVTIPYFLTTFLDINAVSPAFKYTVYAIPFSHLFMTAPNLFLHNYSAVIYGILYQLAWFIVFAVIAIRIFSTEKILVMNLNFLKKKHSS